MIDLSTTYLGLPLSNPLVPSASPLSSSLANIRRMEDAGAGAVVLPSLFEEQIRHESRELDYFLTQGAGSYAEALTYFPEMQDYRLTPVQYLEHIQKAKAAVDIPIIASLNGVSTGSWIQRPGEADWIKYAGAMEEAGADALELNMYFVPTDSGLRGDAVEEMYADLLVDVRRVVSLPIAVKLGPFFSSLPNMAARLVHGGANALVLFNRFYQPTLNLETLEVEPHVELSDSRDLHLPLRWIAILYGRLKADLALTSGVHTAEDALKGLMAGATVTMMASALLRNGIEHLAGVRAGMVQWLEEHEYESVGQMRGSMSQRSVPFPAAFERAQYVRTVSTWRPWRGH